MRNKIVSTARLRFLGQGNPRSALDGLDRRFGAAKTNETLVEYAEPAPQLRRCIPRRIRGNKHELHLIGDIRRQVFQCRADVHMCIGQ